MVTSNSESSGVEFVTITAEEANAMIEENADAIILDVRRQDEYDEKHIPDAVLLPNEIIDTDSVSEASLATDDTILIYCRSGNRSKEAAQKLVDMGYTKVYDFGGINDWPYDVE
jgi:rhodanese-related sulfurtransferase